MICNENPEACSAPRLRHTREKNRRRGKLPSEYRSQGLSRRGVKQGSENVKASEVLGCGRAVWKAW